VPDENQTEKTHNKKKTVALAPCGPMSRRRIRDIGEAGLTLPLVMWGRNTTAALPSLPKTGSTGQGRFSHGSCSYGRGH